MTAPYATVAELRAYVGIPVTDTADDGNLGWAVGAATSQVEDHCDRIFLQDSSPTTRTYFATGMRSLQIDPITSTTGLVVKTDLNDDGVFEVTWALNTDYRLEPINAAALGMPWDTLVTLGTMWFPRTYWHPGVQVTASFGWGATIPDAVKQAVLIQAERLFKRKDAPFGVAGSPEFGSEMRLLPKLDPDVTALLRRYRRNWYVAG